MKLYECDYIWNITNYYHYTNCILKSSKTHVAIE